MRAHRFTHTNTHSLKHAHTHLHTHAHTHIHTHTHTCLYNCVYCCWRMGTMCVCVREWGQCCKASRYIHRLADIHMYIHTHTHTPTRPPTHIPPHMHTRTRTHTHTWIHTSSFVGAGGSGQRSAEAGWWCQGQARWVGDQACQACRWFSAHIYMRCLVIVTLTWHLYIYWLVAV